MSLTAPILAGTATPLPPGWALALTDGDASLRPGECSVRVTQRDDFALISLVVPGAVGLSEDAFRDAVRQGYVEVLEAVAERGHVVRIWNFIPAILAPLGGRQHRYMVFNEGRFAAYEGHYQRVSAFPSAVATASGTGHTGADLVIHALAAGEPGLSVENPRQVPAYRYSERYGPRPPCFARATLLPGGGSSPVRLLVGGTASILGEESRHLDCLETQLEETLRNLDALIGAGQSLVRSAAPRRGGGLSCFREIRVYHPERVPRELLLARINASFASAESVEFVTSDLCRPELMVEIEGLAEI